MLHPVVLYCTYAITLQCSCADQPSPTDILHKVHPGQRGKLAKLHVQKRPTNETRAKTTRVGARPWRVPYLNGVQHGAPPSRCVHPAAKGNRPFGRPQVTSRPYRYRYRWWYRTTGNCGVLPWTIASLWSILHEVALQEVPRAFVLIWWSCIHHLHHQNSQTLHTRRISREIFGKTINFDKH
jgi:hypothetical protein